MELPDDSAVSEPALPARALVEVEGHIIDSLILAKVLDLVLASGGDYTIVDIALGRTNLDPSRARLEVAASSDAALDRLLDALQLHGVNRVDLGVAQLAPAEEDGVLPDGFFSTTNLPTEVLLDGTWRSVENPEMDCGLVVFPDGSVRTVPMHRVARGDQVVVGRSGVRVTPTMRRREASGFQFMDSETSSEKPKGLLIAEVARHIEAAKGHGGKVLVVAGPAVVHTGASRDLAALVRAGFVDVLFAGNGFATHDLESNVLGTSLGVSVREGAPTEGGHANHLRVINAIRRYGSIANAVAAGFVTGGVMFECVRRHVPFILGGSVRDDGPLPDVYTDVVAAADAMRAQLPGVEIALMLATTLHAIATGNMLPATVETYCVDINQAVVTKLSDRGSHQAHGIVTDIGLFVRELAMELGVLT